MSGEEIDIIGWEIFDAVFFSFPVYNYYSSQCYIANNSKGEDDGKSLSIFSNRRNATTECKFTSWKHVNRIRVIKSLLCAVSVSIVSIYDLEWLTLY